MNERKMVRRSIAIALGVICILLIAFIAYFSITGISAQNSYNNLQKSYNSLQNQDNNLNTTYNSYVSTHSHTNAEYDAMWTPELTLIDLTTINNSIVYGSNIAVWSSWLNVTGYLVNIHKNTVYDCTLHVVAIRKSDNATALDSYINLEPIAGESWTKVGPNLYNVFGEISSYTITPQWTASP